MDDKKLSPALEHAIRLTEQHPELEHMLLTAPRRYGRLFQLSIEDIVGASMIVQVKKMQADPSAERNINIDVSLLHALNDNRGNND